MSKKLDTSDNGKISRNLFLRCCPIQVTQVNLKFSELLSTPRSKKLKKQKKQNRSIDVDDSEAVEVVEDSPIEMSAAERLKSLTPKSAAVKPKKKKGRKDSGTSSEEERWLDAIESGTSVIFLVNVG